MAMKKLGLTNEQIHELDPGENPFLNYELGDYSDYNQILDKVSQFYSQLRLQYKMRRDQIIADAEVAHAFTKKGSGVDPADESPNDWPNLEPPEDFESWPKKK